MASHGLEFRYPPIEGVRADLVLVTHEHFDHNAVDAIAGEPTVLGAPGTHDSPIGEVADAADLTLHARVSPHLVFDLHAAPMALAMVLLQAICDAAPARTQARLEAFDASAARRDLFLR